MHKCFISCSRAHSARVHEMEHEWIRSTRISDWYLAYQPENRDNSRMLVRSASLRSMGGSEACPPIIKDTDLSLFNSRICYVDYETSKSRLRLMIVKPGVWIYFGSVSYHPSFPVDFRIYFKLSLISGWFGESSLKYTICTALPRITPVPRLISSESLYFLRPTLQFTCELFDFSDSSVSGMYILFGTRKVPISSIGVSRNPREFRYKTPSCKYFSSPKAWSNTCLFEQWIHEEFVPFVRSHTFSDVALLVDNVSSHLGLKVPLCVQIISLPFYITAVDQLMDMGVIRAWKSIYRRLMLRKILKEI